MRSWRRSASSQAMASMRPGTARRVALFTEVALADSFAEFLTLPAYERMP